VIDLKHGIKFGNAKPEKEEDEDDEEDEDFIPPQEQPNFRSSSAPTHSSTSHASSSHSGGGGFGGESSNSSSGGGGGFGGFGGGAGKEEEDLRYLNKVFLGGVSPESTVDSIKAAFAEYGSVFVKILSDKDTGEKKGIAFVEFGDPSTAASVVELREFLVDGVYVRLDAAKPKKKDGEISNSLFFFVFFLSFSFFFFFSFSPLYSSLQPRRTSSTRVLRKGGNSQRKARRPPRRTRIWRRSSSRAKTPASTLTNTTTSPAMSVARTFQRVSPSRP